jgi:hypothetical protein
VANDAEVLFERIVARFAADSSVTPPSEGGGFGASGLKTDGKLFAMLSKGELVVKLPRERVDELIADGTGTRFDPGHGRLMKEWVAIPVVARRRWAKLAQEAREYAAGQERSGRKKSRRS